LVGEPLPAADLLEELVAAHRADAGCPARLEVTGTPRALPADLGLTVYRVMQEALTNTRRHASGSAAEVRVNYEEAAVTVTVTDKRPPGQHPPGPPPMGQVGSGYGLVGMHERAELLGGTLIVGPTDTGWRVELRIPA
jgi:signal transduction histidine kinase